MTTIVPTLQTVTPPSLTMLLDAHRRDITKNLNAVKVGVVEFFDAEKQEATIKIAQQQVTSIAPDGTKTLADYPLLLNVPVAFQGGGGFTATFPISAGDECLLLFNDRELDNWLTNGPGLAPTTGRVHDLSDAIAIVGIRSNPRALGSVSTGAAQLRTDDGSTFVEVNPTGIKVHAGTVYEWDVHGYGQKITWTGGSNYTIDNYVTGAVVTTNNHAISPPGPP